MICAVSKDDFFCHRSRQLDDPDLETDIGVLPDGCSGDGCGDSDEPVQKFGRSEAWMRGAILGILKKPTKGDPL